MNASYSHFKQFPIGQVGIKHYPKQLWLVQKRVKIWFNDDTRNTAMATIVRCDEGVNAVTVLLLDDGRYVLGTEVIFEP